ncbi:MAG: GNAT family protein, partial [Clostridiales bacterium]
MGKLLTERLVLRPMKKEDCQAVFAYSSSPNVGINAGWKPHETQEETLEIMNLIFLNQETVWGITFPCDDKIIGSIGLVPDAKRENPKVKMLGYGLGEEFWGKGIMTEAAMAVLDFGFRKMKYDLISAYCFPFNSRSKNVLKKCNFQYEGTLKQAEEIF